jgi:hypothetical protein
MRPDGRGAGWNDLGQALFGSTGWLFADLMLALAMTFLVANTVAEPPPPTTTTTTVVPTTTTRPPARPRPLPALRLQPVKVRIRVDQQGLLRGAPAAIASAQRQVRARRALAGRRAGLVLTFAGASGSSPDQARRVAETVNEKVLKGLGRRGFVFKRTVYRPFFALNSPAGIVEADVYVFERQPGG